MYKKVLKVLGGLVLVVAVLLLVVIKYSSAEIRFECAGESMIRDRPATVVPRTVFIKLARYRWWVRLWSDSYGAMWLEVPNSTVRFFSRIEKMGDQLVIGDDEAQNQAGFSLLSHALDVNLDPTMFNGLCHPISRE